MKDRAPTAVVREEEEELAKAIRVSSDRGGQESLTEMREEGVAFWKWRPSLHRNPTRSSVAPSVGISGRVVMEGQSHVSFS